MISFCAFLFAIVYKNTLVQVLFVVKVESLFEDEDFRMKVTREQFEHLCQDLVDRIDKVIQDAFSTAELTAVCLTFLCCVCSPYNNLINVLSQHQ